MARNRINFGTIKQASKPKIAFLWPLDSSHTPNDFTGFIVTGTMYQVDNDGATTSISGTFTVTDGATREIEWAMSSLDTGTDGVFRVTLSATDGVDSVYSLYGDLEIENNPSVDAVQNPPLVGVPSDDASWLTTAVATVPDATQLAGQDDLALKVDKSGDSMTGDLTMIDASIVNPDTVDFATDYTPTGSEPTGSMYWNSDDDEMGFVVDQYGTISIGAELWKRMTNLSGAQVVNGDVVSGIGASGNRQAFVLTDATDKTKALNCIGMVTVPTINNNVTGRITKSGEVRDLDTSSFAEGAIIYVDPANHGKLTDIEPAAGNYIISVGVVLVSHINQGVINVDIRIIPKMAELSDVNGTALTTDGQFNVWNNAAGYFDPTANVSDFDQAGSAATVQTNLDDHKSAIGTAVHGLGSIATEDATDYYPKTDFSASPVADEPIKADGSGGINGTIYKVSGTNALQVFSDYTIIGDAGGGSGFVSTGATLTGKNAGFSNTGISVAGHGYRALYQNTGSYATGVGNQAGLGNSGILSAFVGHFAGNGNSGAYALGFGQSAARNNTGVNVIAIGSEAALGNTHNRSISIGNNTIPTKSNQFITGSPTNLINSLTIVSGLTGSLEGTGKSSTTDGASMGRVEWSWNVSTHASREADLTLYASDYGGEREGLRIRANGTEPETSVNGATPIARQLLATGTGATVDDIITVLQNFGIAKQS